MILWLSACGSTPPPPQRTMPSRQTPAPEADTRVQTDDASEIVVTDVEDLEETPEPIEGAFSETTAESTAESKAEPTAEPMEAEAPQAPLIRYFVGDQEYTLDTLRDAELPDNTTVRISAHRHATHGLVTDSLIEIHSMGYVVEFAVEDPQE